MSGASYLTSICFHSLAGFAGAAGAATLANNLYFKLSEHAIKMAMRMKDIFTRKGFEFLVDSPTNQQFVIIDNEQADRLSQKMQFTHFGQTDHYHTICRFVTSWSTTEEEIDELERILNT